MARRAWREKRNQDSIAATSHAFILPALLATPSATLAGRATTWAARTRTSEQNVAAIQAEIDDLAFGLYGLDAADRAALAATLTTESTADAAAEAGDDEEDEAASAAAPALTADLLAYALGTAFGRWDMRLVTGEKPAPPTPDPFAPLPVCPPGMLQNAEGLPATETPQGYPLRVSWDGLLVDDPGSNGGVPHKEDLVRRVREVLDVIFKDRAEAIEQEACQILGVADLRDYFRNPSAFFNDHLKRYSKSRRKAPIYWPLSTASGSYTVWVYYPRLSDQTPYAIVNQFIEPKIETVKAQLAVLDNRLGQASGRAATELRDQTAEAKQYLDELEDFRAELLRVAKLPYKPDLNDGVIICAAPLHKLFRHRGWAKETEECWRKLEAGDYDWAHLAHAIWPKRIEEVCKTDRSIAIAHGLEALCTVEAPEPKAKRSKGKGKKKVQEDELLEE